MSQAEKINTTNLSRRAALAGLAGAAVAGGVALPAAVAAISSEPLDPIFAAIPEYKTAVAARGAALEATWDSGCEALAGLPQNAPACIAAHRVHDEAGEWIKLAAELEKNLAKPLN